MFDTSCFIKQFVFMLAARKQQTMNSTAPRTRLIERSYWYLGLLGHQTLDFLAFAKTRLARVSLLTMVRTVSLLLIVAAIANPNFSLSWDLGGGREETLTALEANAGPKLMSFAGLNTWFSRSPAQNHKADELAHLAIDRFESLARREEKLRGVEGTVLLAAAVMEAIAEEENPNFLPFSSILSDSKLSDTKRWKLMSETLLSDIGNHKPATLKGWISLMAQYYPQPYVAENRLSYLIERYSL